MMFLQIMMAFVKEQSRQRNELGYTEQHDDEHTPFDFAEFIEEQTDKILSKGTWDRPEVKERFIKIGALCLSAIEHIERREEREADEAAYLEYTKKVEHSKALTFEQWKNWKELVSAPVNQRLWLQPRPVLEMDSEPPSVPLFLERFDSRYGTPLFPQGFREKHEGVLEILKGSSPEIEVEPVLCQHGLKFCKRCGTSNDAWFQSTPRSDHNLFIEQPALEPSDEKNILLVGGLLDGMKVSEADVGEAQVIKAFIDKQLSEYSGQEFLVKNDKGEYYSLSVDNVPSSSENKADNPCFIGEHQMCDDPICVCNCHILFGQKE